jgi:predicted branched-subunit amino acid permease
LSDESYAAAMAAHEGGKGNAWHFLGSNLCIWIVWWPSGLVGAWVGEAVPDLSRYGLEMVFPLAFIGLAASFFQGTASAAAAVVAGIAAVAGALWLPGTWYIIVAGLLGSSAGLLAARRAQR